jgi:pimeloyl-ACP methyl ester carboxylesterase
MWYGTTVSRRMRKARNVGGAIVAALGVLALVIWAMRARWLPFAIAAAPNAGKTVAELDRGAPLAPAVALVSRDLRIEVGAGTPEPASLSVRLLETNATPPRGTIFVFHGIRDSKSSMLATGASFARAGFRVVLVDARGQGRSTGEWLSFGAREGIDMKEVADTLAARGELSLPVGAYGPSYGGAVALQMARRDARVRAVVTVATFTRMTEVVPLYAERIVPTWLVTRADVSTAMARAGALGGFRPEEADSVAAIAATDAQVLVMHGRADGNIPWEHGETLHGAAPDRSRLIVIDGKDHRTIMSDAKVLEESVDWFQRWL